MIARVLVQLLDEAEVGARDPPAGGDMAESIHGCATMSLDEVRGGDSHRTRDAFGAVHEHHCG